MQHGAQVRRTAHLEHDRGHQPFLPVHPRAGQREPFHLHASACGNRRKGFEILQAIELAGTEFFRRKRGADHDLDDIRREALHALHGGDQLVCDPRKKLRRRRVDLRLAPLEDPRYDRVTLLGRAHCLHDVTEERRVHIAEVADEAAVRRPCEQHVGRFGLGGRALRLDRVAFLVAGGEVFSVQHEVLPVLARKDGIGLRAGGDKHGVRRQPGPARFVLEAHAFNRAIVVDVDHDGRQALGKRDAFLERLFHFLVV